MTANSIAVRLVVVGDEHLPECRIGGTRRDIPTITWAQDLWAEVEISLGNHPDPADYLDRLGHRLIAFGVEVRQAELDRAADEPVPFVPAEATRS